MRPVKTDSSNLKLVHPEAGDLPAEGIVINALHPGDPDDHPGHPTMGIETVWRPDPGEQKALANGAPVHLRIYGAPLNPDLPSRDQLPAHPPVSLQAGVPPVGAGVELIAREHFNMAMGYVFAAIRDEVPGSFSYVTQTHSEDDGHRIEGGGTIMQIDGWISLCERALEHTRDSRRGEGPSISDLALPSDIRDRENL